MKDPGKRKEGCGAGEGLLLGVYRGQNPAQVEPLQLHAGWLGGTGMDDPTRFCNLPRGVCAQYLNLKVQGVFRVIVIAITFPVLL